MKRNTRYCGLDSVILAESDNLNYVPESLAQYLHGNSVDM